MIILFFFCENVYISLLHQNMFQRKITVWFIYNLLLQGGEKAMYYGKMNTIFGPKRPNLVNLCIRFNYKMKFEIYWGRVSTVLCFYSLTVLPVFLIAASTVSRGSSVSTTTSCFSKLMSIFSTPITRCQNLNSFLIEKHAVILPSSLVKALLTALEQPEQVISTLKVYC